jgi:hypothetical protein
MWPAPPAAPPVPARRLSKEDDEGSRRSKDSSAWQGRAGRWALGQHWQGLQPSGGAVKSAPGGGSPSARLLSRVEALPLPLPRPPLPLTPPPGAGAGAGAPGGRGGRPDGSPGAAGGRGSSPKGVAVVSELGRAKGVTMPAMTLAGDCMGSEGKSAGDWGGAVECALSLCCTAGRGAALAPAGAPHLSADPA